MLAVAVQKYGVAEKPQGRLQDKLDVAVDAIAALTLGECTWRLLCCSGNMLTALPSWAGCHCPGNEIVHA